MKDTKYHKHWPHLVISVQSQHSHHPTVLLLLLPSSFYTPLFLSTLTLPRPSSTTPSCHMWEAVRQVHRNVGDRLLQLTDIRDRTRLVSAYWGDTASFSYSYFLCLSLFLGLWKTSSLPVLASCVWFESSCNCSPSLTPATISSCWLIPSLISYSLG